MPSSAVEPAGPALGPRLTGLDLAMLGDDAWDDAFMTLMFEFERPVPELEGVLRASSGAARVRELLDEQRRAFQQEFAEREAALQQTERDLVAKRGELSEADFASQLAEFEAEVTQIQKEIQYRREAIDIAFQEAQTKLRDIAIQIVTELAQEKRLDVVLVRETALIFRPSLNLSAEVLRRLDERTKNARIEVTIGATGAAE